MILNEIMEMVKEA